LFDNFLPGQSIMVREKKREKEKEKKGEFGRRIEK
jgi:hypothetical protein